MSCQGSAAGTLGSKTSNPVPVVTKHPSPSNEEPVWALMYISFLFLSKQTLFTLLHRQRKERKDMTRSCGDGVKHMNGRGNNGHVDSLANSAIAGQLVVMGDTGKISAMALAV